MTTPFEQYCQQGEQYRRIAQKIINIYSDEGAFEGYKSGRDFHYGALSLKNPNEPWQPVPGVVFITAFTHVGDSSEGVGINAPFSFLDSFDEAKVRETAKAIVVQRKTVEDAAKAARATEKEAQNLEKLRELAAQYPDAIKILMNP